MSDNKNRPPAKRILIVDDEEPIRFALSTILQEQGHEVDACETGGGWPGEVDGELL